MRWFILITGALGTLAALRMIVKGHAFGPVDAPPDVGSVSEEWLRNHIYVDGKE